MSRPNLVVVLLLSFFVIIPFFYLAFFTQPSADDFSYGVGLMDHSLWDVNVTRYLNWGSRYTATTILSLSPMAFHTLNFFWIYPLALLMFMLIIFYHLFKIITYNRNNAMVGSVIVNSIILLLMPSTTEGIYWLAGTATYTFPYIFFLTLIVKLYQYNTVDNTSLISKLILVGLVIVIFGGSEIILPLTCLVLFLNTIKNIFTSRFKFSVSIFILSILLFIFIYFAPGNHVRSIASDPSETVSFIGVLKLTLSKMIIITIRYSIFIFCFAVIFFKLSNIEFKRFTGLPFQTTSILLVLGYLSLLFITCFIPLYGLKYYFPLRVENLVILLLLPILIVAALIIQPLLTKFKPIYFVACLAFVSGVYFLVPKNAYITKNNLHLVYSDIFSGKVDKYREEIDGRHKLSSGKEGKDVVLPPIVNKPMSIFFKDLNSKPTHYYNVSYAKFYGMRSVKIKEKQ